MKKFLLWIIVSIWVIGVVLRLDVFLINKPLWHDECSLALSLLDRGIFDYFRPLEHFQCAPPFFMILTNLITKIFGIKEFSLRLIPLLAGILSMPAFFILTKKIFKNSWTIIIGNLLFAINYQLICYSQEFKQYSLDTLLCILTIYYLVDFDIKLATKKQVTIFAIIIALLPLLSFPTVFILLSYFIIQFLKHKKAVLLKLFLSAIPIFLTLLVYYIKVAVSSHTAQIENGSYMWDAGFLKLSIPSLISVLKLNFDYFFIPNTAILLGSILLILGIKNEKGLLTGTIATSLIVSFFKLYPLYQRTCLYLIPIFLILLLIPLDKISKPKKLYSTIVILLTIGYFGNYMHGYKDFVNSNIKNKEDAKSTLKILKDNYKTGEIVCFNDASTSEFIFYGRYYNFVPIPNIKITAQPEENYITILNQLPKGYTYWFYYPFEFTKSPVINTLKEWSKTKKIFFEYENNNSYIIKLAN